MSSSARQRRCTNAAIGCTLRREWQPLRSNVWSCRSRIQRNEDDDEEEEDEMEEEEEEEMESCGGVSTATCRRRGAG